LRAGARRAASRIALELAGWRAARGVEDCARACGLARGARRRGLRSILRAGARRAASRLALELAGWSAARASRTALELAG
jgi:hypothetical protein